MSNVPTNTRLLGQAAQHVVAGHVLAKEGDACMRIFMHHECNLFNRPRQNTARPGGCGQRPEDARCVRMESGVRRRERGRVGYLACLHFAQQRTGLRDERVRTGSILHGSAVHRAHGLGAKGKAGTKAHTRSCGARR